MVDGTAADTFPKLLIRNAQVRGTRPAIRHKDLGIWQTWTWVQVREEVAAFSVGLDELGADIGLTIEPGSDLSGVGAAREYRLRIRDDVLPIGQLVVQQS